MGDLSNADVRVVQLGTSSGCLEADVAAPRVPHQVDLVLIEAVGEVAGHFQGVSDELLGGHVLGGQRGVERKPSTALFPRHDREVLLQTGRVPLRQPIRGHPGPAVHKQQNGIPGVVARDDHALVRVVDIHVDLLRNTV